MPALDCHGEFPTIFFPQLRQNGHLHLLYQVVFRLFHHRRRNILLRCQAQFFQLMEAHDDISIATSQGPKGLIVLTACIIQLLAKLLKRRYKSDKLLVKQIATPNDFLHIACLPFALPQ